jgi:hypothetical protein
MKVLFHFALLFLFSFSSYAQLATVEFGSEGKETKFNFYPQIVGEKSGNTYVLRMRRTGAPRVKLLKGSEKKAKLMLLAVGAARFRDDSRLNEPEFYFTPSAEYSLEIYDQKAQQKSNSPIALPDVKGEDFMVRRMYMFNEKLWLFATTWYDKEKKTVARFFEIDDQGKFGVSVEAGMISGKTSDNESDNNTYEVAVSQKGSKVAVFSHEMSDLKVNPKFHFHVLGPDLKTIWKKSLSLKDNPDIDIQDVQVDDRGSVTLITRVFYEKGENDASAQRFYCRIYEFGAEGNDYLSYDLKLQPDQYVSDIKVFHDANDNLVIDGFYSQKSANKIKGFFSRVLSAEGMKETAAVTKELPPSFFTEFLGEKRGSRVSELSELHIRKAYPQGDGTVTFVAERYFIDVVNNSGSSMLGGGSLAGMSNQTFNYTYEDIMVFNLRPDGELNWCKKVVKYQTTVDDGAFYNSFCSYMKEGNLFLFYNAHRDDPDNRMSNTNRCTAYVSKLDPKGSLSTEKLFNAKVEEVTMTPRFHYFKPDGTLFIHNIKGSNFRFANIRF